MSRTAIINMFQFRKDYNKIKAMTKTTHERYILEIFRGYIIENTIKTEVEAKKMHEYVKSKMKTSSMYGYIDTDMIDNEGLQND